MAFLGSFAFHETPKYLILSRKDHKEAKLSITYYQGKGIDVNKILAEIEAESVTNETVKINIYALSPKSHLAFRFGSPKYCSISVHLAFIHLFSQRFGSRIGHCGILDCLDGDLIRGWDLGGMFWIARYLRRHTLLGFSTINIGSLALYAIFAALTKYFAWLRYGSG